jgi:hypothetical protein
MARHAGFRVSFLLLLAARHVSAELVAGGLLTRAQEPLLTASCQKPAALQKAENRKQIQIICIILIYQLFSDICHLSAGKKLCGSDIWVA